MKKKLILFTALFAGTIISNDICAGNVLNQNDNQENADENLQEPILDATHEQTELNHQEQNQEQNQAQDQDQEQGNLEKGAINSNLASETPTEIVLKLREEIGQLFEKTQIKEIERYDPDVVQNIKHKIMISNDKDELKFAIKKVEKFFKITTEYGYESLLPDQKQCIFDHILNSWNLCEVNLTHAKTIEFLRIANMNGYENITNDEKKEILKNIFKDIFDTNNFRSCKAKVQQFIEKYNLK